MGTIREKIELIGTRKRKKITALFDTGACRNYIRKMLEDGDRTEDIGFHIFEGIHRAILANGDIAVGEKVRFKIIRIKGISFKEPEFVIMENLIEDMIIGVDLMQKLGLTLDPSNEKIKRIMIK
jgi:predicted aspartyl protease